MNTDSEGNIQADESSDSKEVKSEPQVLDVKSDGSFEAEVVSKDVNGKTKEKEGETDIVKTTEEIPVEKKKVVGETEPNRKPDEGKNTQVKEENVKGKKHDTNKVHLHDTDDYLLHLQDILRTIHHAYFSMYEDNLKKNEVKDKVPDMKCVLPYVRRKVLEKINIVFSGVVPTNIPLNQSKPCLVAKSLGANVSDKVMESTTHLIAARLGTAKVILLFFSFLFISLYLLLTLFADCRS